MWPMAEKAGCKISGYQTWSNIVLRDIYINNPLVSEFVCYCVVCGVHLVLVECSVLCAGQTQKCSVIILNLMLSHLS